MISWIDDNLALGSAEDAKEHQELRKLGVVFIIDIRSTFVGSVALGGAIPDVSKIEQLVRGLRLLTSEGYKVLIHCHVGIDRSPFVAMLYIAYKYNLSTDLAYTWIKEKRPEIIEHWEWVEVKK